MRKLAWAAALLALVLEGLAQAQGLHRVFWQLAVVVQGYGHWLGLGLLALLVADLLRLEKGWPRRAALLLGAGLLFLPLLVATALAPGLRASAAAAFPGLDPSPIRVSWLRSFAPAPSGAAPKAFIYARRADGDLSLDFYRLAGPGPFPFVVVLHPGGWDSGSRGQFPELSQHLAARGIAVADLDYRLAPRHPWPAAKEDLDEAAAWLRAHAAELGLDPGRWALLGRSAGGQIVERAAYGDGLPGLKACIAFYAPSDLNFSYSYATYTDVISSKSLDEAYLGGSPATRQAGYDDASGIRFVGARSVPTLLFHGPGDPLVRYAQSARLDARLAEAGVPRLLARLPGATHGFDFAPRGPYAQLSSGAVDAFLDWSFAR